MRPDQKAIFEEWKKYFSVGREPDGYLATGEAFYRIKKSDVIIYQSENGRVNMKKEEKN